MRFLQSRYWLVGISMLALGCSEKPEAFAGKKTPAPQQLHAESATFKEAAAFSIDEQFTPAPACNIERINETQYSGEFAVSSQNKMAISGWVVDSEANRLPENIFLRAERDDRTIRYYAPVFLSISRADIVQLYGGNTALLRAGYSATIRPQSLPAGKYRLQTVFFSQGKSFICDNGRILTVN